MVYDRCYRRRAALTKDLNWSVQHTALYNEAFTGWACTILRCTYCLSKNHAVGDCPDCPQGLPHHSRQAPTGLYEPPATVHPYESQRSNRAAHQPQPPPNTAGSSTRSGAAVGGATTGTSAAIAHYLTPNGCDLQRIDGRGHHHRLTPTASRGGAHQWPSWPRLPTTVALTVDSWLRTVVLYCVVLHRVVVLVLYAIVYPLLII